MDAETQIISMRWPILVLAISASAAIIFSFPGLISLFIFNRAAIANGELWRLATGNLVHFSTAHLTYNLIAFFIAGIIISTRDYPFFPSLCISAAVIIGIVIYLAEPTMYFYGGLSGVVTAAVTYLCLYGVTEKGVWRWLCFAMLVGLTAKCGIELIMEKSFLTAISTETFSPAPLSHLAGAVTAILLFTLLRTSASRKNQHE